MEKMLIRLQYDLDNLEHRSWALDTTILLKTFLYIFGKIFLMFAQDAKSLLFIL